MCGTPCYGLDRAWSTRQRSREGVWGWRGWGFLVGLRWPRGILQRPVRFKLALQTWFCLTLPRLPGSILLRIRNNKSNNVRIQPLPSSHAPTGRTACECLICQPKIPKPLPTIPSYITGGWGRCTYQPQEDARDVSISVYMSGLRILCSDGWRHM